MMQYNKQYLELVQQVPEFEQYQFFKHLSKREIILNGEIDDSLVERVIMPILEWNEEDKDIPTEERKPIKLFTHSAGGDVYLGLVLCNVIKQSKTPVHSYTLGVSASMGCLIAISAHKRMAYEGSNFLIHDGSVHLSGSSNKIKDTMKFNEEKDLQIKNLILEKTNISEEKYDEMLDREWWMTAKTALENGLIDNII